MFKKQFTDLQNACAFAEAIVNTVREPLVVIDKDLRVVLRVAHSIGRSRSAPRIPKASCFTS
jgi:hypothetical protein